MNFKFNRGYVVYDSSESDLVFATPHSGPAMGSATSRDDNSETVAGMCWRKMGGKLVVSTVPRARFWGIDFNRDIPPKTLAISNYSSFKQDTESGTNIDYMKKYAWVAKDEGDYDNRLKIYQSFWSEVNKGNKIVLIHKAFNRVRSLPSIIDFVTFRNQGISEEMIGWIVEELNKKYKFFLSSVNKSYKEAVLEETKRRVLSLIRAYGSFDLNKFNAQTVELMEKDVKKMENYATHHTMKKLKENFTCDNYLKAVGETLNNSREPEITIENVADGSLAHGPDRKLFPTTGKVIIEVEPTHFMNFWYPNTTSEIICDVIKALNN